MHRRSLLATLAVTPWLGLAPPLLWAATTAAYQKLLVLVELKGGNDGLNTLVPYADATYYQLRPRLAIARDQVLQLDDKLGLHPALQPLHELWRQRELAVLQGVGYPKPNLSHFRSIEIWDTASRADEILAEGWLTRLLAQSPAPRHFAADGIVLGNHELGPLEGGARAIALANAEQFQRQAKLANDPAQPAANSALNHILKVEGDIRQAASQLKGDFAFKTAFPATALGNALKTTAQVLATGTRIAAARISHNGFDTHTNQPNTQTRLLRELAEGLLAFRSALQEIDQWRNTCVLTYAEFGRRPKENMSNGTDHGTANVHFALGGSVRGGLYGATPSLRQLDGGNLLHAVDFRSVYATAIERLWGLPTERVLGGKFRSMDWLR